jgi:hypothetical protein
LIGVAIKAHVSRSARYSSNCNKRSLPARIRDVASHFPLRHGALVPNSLWTIVDLKPCACQALFIAYR